MVPDPNFTALNGSCTMTSPPRSASNVPPVNVPLTPSATLLSNAVPPLNPSILTLLPIASPLSVNSDPEPPAAIKVPDRIVASRIAPAATRTELADPGAAADAADGPTGNSGVSDVDRGCANCARCNDLAAGIADEAAQINERLRAGRRQRRNCGTAVIDGAANIQLSKAAGAGSDRLHELAVGDSGGTKDVEKRVVTARLHCAAVSRSCQKREIRLTR